MRMYLAALYRRRDELCYYVEQVEAYGHVVTSTWLRPRTGDGFGIDYMAPAAESFARADLADVASSEMLVLFTEPRGEPQPGGGRFVEFGYALALRKQLAVVGPVENLFCGLPSEVQHFTTWADFLVAARNL